MVPDDERRLFAGWGRTVPTRAEVHEADSAKTMAAAFDGVGERGVIVRGLGRAYGDAAQCAGGRVVVSTAHAGLSELDLEGGRVTAAAGTSFDQLMRWLVPLGYFVPVTPGTRYVTVGGAIASDIHGKNHHVDGTFGSHVERIGLQLADGSRVDVTPTEDADLFWATCGGMGLTGVVLDATFRLAPIETSRLLVDTDRTPDLDALMTAMLDRDDEYRFSVAWIDLMSTGARMGRGALTRGRFAERHEVGDDVDPLSFAPRVLVSAPPVFPAGLLNRWSVRAFNEFWFRRHPAHRVGELQTIAQFFHPLDMVDHWNRIYGPHGFLQWQVVLPDGEEATLRHIVERLSGEGYPSFLAVLKRFGAENEGPLSFPKKGWTLALDIPAATAGLGEVLDALDERVVEADGRVYLAKDSRVRPELLEQMYPRLGEWRAVRDRVDPQRRLQSDLGRRLKL